MDISVTRASRNTAGDEQNTRTHREDQDTLASGSLYEIMAMLS